MHGGLGGMSYWMPGFTVCASRTVILCDNSLLWCCSLFELRIHISCHIWYHTRPRKGIDREQWSRNDRQCANPKNIPTNNCITFPWLIARMFLWTITYKNYTVILFPYRMFEGENERYSMVAVWTSKSIQSLAISRIKYSSISGVWPPGNSMDTAPNL